MKTQLKIFLSLLMISLLGISTVNSNLFAQKVFEGYWESETITKSTLPMQPANKIEKQKTYFKNGKMKTVNTTDNTTIIYRFDKGVAWTLDRKNKTYNEMHFDQLQAGMKNAKNKMAQAMKEMDPEEREMMKKMMGGKMGAMMGQSEEPAISFNHTGKKKTIKGYSCSQVIMNLGDEPMMEMWMTNKFNLGNDFLKNLWDYLILNKKWKYYHFKYCHNTNRKLSASSQKKS